MTLEEVVKLLNNVLAYGKIDYEEWEKFKKYKKPRFPEGHEIIYGEDAKWRKRDE